MLTIPDSLATELVWVKPRWWKLQFELRTGDSVIATLDWARGASAEGRWGDGPGYRFQRVGWWRQRVDVYTAGAPDIPLATFEQRSGALTLANGRVFHWRSPGKLTSERIWVDEAGTELVRCRPSSWRRPGSVVVLAAARDLPEAPILVLLGQFLHVAAAQDTEAASVAVVTSFGA